MRPSAALLSLLVLIVWISGLMKLKRTGQSIRSRKLRQTVVKIIEYAIFAGGALRPFGWSGIRAGELLRGKGVDVEVAREDRAFAGGVVVLLC